MIQLLCVHATAALIAPTLFRVFGRRTFGLLALVPASAAAWAIVQTWAVFGGAQPEQRHPWVPGLALNLEFRLDALSWLMTLIVGGVGAIILIYCWCYFGRTATALGRFGGVFVAFAGAMLGLVTADNTLLVYLFWELTTVFSFLLIGHYHDRQPSRRAAMQAITVTTFGGLAMLAGLLMLGMAPGGSFRLGELVTRLADHTLGPDLPAGYLITAVVLVLLGALTKSAQLPFHFWLPAAMAAPTPVSAYLHAAAMVKAGIYLVARLAPGFWPVPGWQPIVLVVGLGTMLLGGYRALRQQDLKLLLAYGTVSQLGFIMLLVGHGERAIALAGLTMLGAHTLFKAALFLTVGTIDHELGTRDLRELSGVARAMPGLALTATLAAASMAGLPPTIGYVGKEAALEAFSHAGHWVVFAAVVLGSMLTFGYSARFWWGAFAVKPGLVRTPARRLDGRLVVPIAVLAIAGLVLGLLPGRMSALLAAQTVAYPGEAGQLTLWSGFGWSSMGTVLIIGGGTALFCWRDRVQAVQARIRLPAASDTYRAITTGIDRIAADLTAFVQTGSLPSYLSVLFGAVVVAALGVLSFGDLPGLVEVRMWDSPLQAAVVLLACLAALLVVRSRRRMKAVLLLAFVGYATALLFALQGAPDLALTQAVVETVTLVVFVLVLRRLPPYFSNRPWVSSRIGRMVTGALAGISVALLGWVAASARVHAPVTVDYPGEVLDFGYGFNIVNVTLVDTRAWDTMGELSVLLAAATGVASLVFIRERAQRPDLRQALRTALASRQVWSRGGQHPGARAEHYLARGKLGDHRPQLRPERRGRTWLPGVATLAPVRRSLIFEIGARLVFHPLLLFSLFLLFSGHNHPGGGFAGGVLAGIALTIRYLAGGRYELALAARLRPGTLLGTGMIIATTAALAPVPLGGTILQTTKVDLVLPVFNQVHLATALFFDVGVYLIVIGLVLDVLSSLGAEVDRQAEAEGISAPDVAHDDTRVVHEEFEVGTDTRSQPAVAEQEAGR